MSLSPVNVNLVVYLGYSVEVVRRVFRGVVRRVFRGVVRRVVREAGVSLFNSPLII